MACRRDADAYTSKCFNKSTLLAATKVLVVQGFCLAEGAQKGRFVEV